MLATAAVPAAVCNKCAACGHACKRMPTGLVLPLVMSSFNTASLLPVPGVKLQAAGCFAAKCATFQVHFMLPVMESAVFIALLLLHLFALFTLMFPRVYTLRRL